MSENNKKTLLIVIGVLLIILVGIGIGCGVYFLNKDKNENVNDKTENNTTESEILKDAKSLNLSANELDEISKELKNNIPFFSIYDLSYDKAMTGYNIFESKQEIYNFLVNYIMRYDKTNQNITDSDFVYYDDSDEIKGVKKEFINKAINKIFAVEKIKDDTDNKNYVIVADGGGELGIQIKVTDKLYNSNTKEYFLRIEFVDEESGKKERSAILTYIEKDNQKLIKSFIYTNDISNSQDNNNCKFYNDLASSDEVLKNKCTNVTEEELKEDGFEKLDFKSININSEMKTDYEEYDFSSKKFDSVNALENNGTVDIQEVKLVLENNKAYYYFNDNKIEIKVDNVKSIYIHNAECTTVVDLYLLTTNGDVYKLLAKNYFDDIKLEELNQYANSFEKVTINQKFVKLKELHIGDTTCGYYYDVLGITEAGEKYSLNNNRKYDYVKEVQLNEDANEKYFVKSNREIEYKNNIIHTNIKQILGEFFISEDDYLYSLDNNSKVEDSKIKTIYYYPEELYYAERYIIEFENKNKLILMWYV